MLVQNNIAYGGERQYVYSPLKAHDPMSRARAMPDASVLWSVPELTVSTAGAKMGRGDGGGDTVEEGQGSAIEASRQE